MKQAFVFPQFYEKSSKKIHHYDKIMLKRTEIYSIMVKECFVYQTQKEL
jgi:tRNA A37 threonylcarbamoyladenosine biosynthesis protein TsaE